MAVGWLKPDPTFTLATHSTSLFLAINHFSTHSDSTPPGGAKLDLCRR